MILKQHHKEFASTAFAKSMTETSGTEITLITDLGGSSDLQCLVRS